MNSLSYDYLLKIILVGDSAVGKTSLMKMFVDNIFDNETTSTIGVDFKIKTIEIDNKKIKLQIWDTAGQEKFKSIVSHYYRGANGILLLFDITNNTSFNHLDDWMNEILKKTTTNNVEIFILANKIDAGELISQEIVIEFLKKHNIPESNFYKVSALENKNVSNSFINLAKKIVEKQGNKIVRVKPKVYESTKVRRWCWF